MISIREQVEQARKRLLDLTMRNRLLNFRPLKRGTLKIIDEIPREVYDILVIQGKTMDFKPTTDDEENEDELFNEAEEETELWSLPLADTEIAERHTDRFLQTPLKVEELYKRLFNIHHKSRSVLEEQGYGILFLALGFLRYLESPNSTELRKAPLILIPVELERKGVRPLFKVRWTGDDVSGNISLYAKLAEQGITIPQFEMPDEKEGIDEYFDKVKKAIPYGKWLITTDIYLSFFNFKKFVMYKDLDPEIWSKSLSDHPLLRVIFSPSEDTSPTPVFSEEEIDKKIKADTVYHILDADSSQIAVIEDAKAGRNLVVEGPPGTGKSQTIVNIIAELLATGKTVLFVSEKMAALEVVKNRLDRLGLGEFCLELHSRKTRKKRVLDELKRCSSIESSPGGSSSSLEKEDFIKHEKLKSELNEYCKALSEPIGNLGYSPFGLIGLKEDANRHFRKTGKKIPHIPLPDVEKLGKDDYPDTEEKLKDLADALLLVSPVERHPWRGCNPGTVLPSEEEEIEGLLNECIKALERLLTSIRTLSDTCAIRYPEKADDIESASNAARTLLMSKEVGIEAEVLLNPEWNEPQKKPRKLIAEVESFQATVRNGRFKQEALEQDVAPLLEEYNNLYRKFWRCFCLRWWRLKREIRSLYKGKAPWGTKWIISHLKELLRLKDTCEKIRAENGNAIFGRFWKADKSDMKQLKAILKWMTLFRKQLSEGWFNEQSLRRRVSVSKAQLDDILHDIENKKGRFFRSLRRLIERLNIKWKSVFPDFGTVDATPFLHIKPRLIKWKEELPKLRNWSLFMERYEAALKTVAKPLAEKVMQGGLNPEDIVPCFKGSVAEALLRKAILERPSLKGFEGQLHEGKIARFRRLDIEVIERNSGRLRQKLLKNRPVILGGVSLHSEAGILLREFTKKRRHMPLRKLMKKAGGIIQRIKPCFMMSPLSIAQFLDPDTVRFDVIIFDEASQVRPEDALGTFIRGKQAVIMGDTRQLPPTAFFDHLIDDIEEEADESYSSVAETESILHLCKRSFPTRLLRWHYRSKHESLIAVSNQEFYDNRLFVYPSPIAESEHLGLKFVYLPDTVYDRGRSRTNRKEARAVAEAAVEHYRAFPDKSLGIGTFNISQQQAILEEIELQLRRNPEMEEHFSSDKEEHFFVKNLETIQGDERDVIFLSVGYGFDASGRLTTNFGPLNAEGGWRRLNVLITRAREKCVVFSNFRASDLRVDEKTPRGVKALRVFLEYAENKTLYSIDEGLGESESPFEEAVYEFLVEKGYEVKRQVGCAGYRIDLAIVDSERPGNYLLGIECDGARYHSSPVARDRDRLRQQILEKLGWTICRVWSTDWYRNRTETEKKILRAIERAKMRRGRPIKKRLEEETDTTRSGKGEEREKTEPVRKSIEQTVPVYKACSALTIRIYGDLCEQPISRLVQAVVDVVKVEQPVHVDEVIRRIRSLWGLKRTGTKIRRTLKRAITKAVRDGKVYQKKDFLWLTDKCKTNVRCRCDDPPPDISLICNEEIVEAIKLVIRRQFATRRDDLIKQSARLLGIRSVSDITHKRIDGVIKSLLMRRMLKTHNGMIDLTDY